MTRDVVSFSLSGGELTVRDEAGGGEMTMEVDAGATTTPATDAWFDVPVDGAVTVDTSSIEIRGATSAQVRRAGGEHRGSIQGKFSADGETYIDVSAALKLLIYADGPMTGRIGGDVTNPEALFVTLEEPTHLVIGARSYHEEPIATMTVTDNPEDLMTAASYLGSSMKEWTAERSWPTLRGHPPAIEVGEELHIPQTISRPAPDVTVAVPPNTADVLRVTPLAHYFGADVVPGDRGELRLGTHHVEPLGTGAELEQSVDDLLVHAVVLDSLVRIGGYYSMPRYEYDELAPGLPFYPPELYDEPIHRQLLEYLEVSFDTVRPYAPSWHAVGTLQPIPEDAEAVPYLLNTLARVHVTEDGIPRRPAEPGKPVQISTSRTVPRNVATLPPAARKRAADHEVRPSGDVSVLFVGWEPPERDRFAEADWNRFEVDGVPTATYRPSVTRDELETLLGEPFTYVHYADGVTEEGFVCSDGVLPFEDLPEGTVGAISFQWHRSVTPDLEAIHEVASVACLLDRPIALETAQEIAVYLTIGRSLAASCQLAGVEAFRFHGDATLSVARRPTGHPPLVAHVCQVGDDEYRVTERLDSDDHDLIGRVASIRAEKAPDHFQLAGTRMEITEPLSRSELSEFLMQDNVFRFDWCPDSENPTSMPTIDDLLPE